MSSPNLLIQEAILILKQDNGGLREYLKSFRETSKVLEQYDYFIKYMGSDCKYTEICLKMLIPRIEDYLKGTNGK